MVFVSVAGPCKIGFWLVISLACFGALIVHLFYITSLYILFKVSQCYTVYFYIHTDVRSYICDNVPNGTIKVFLSSSDFKAMCSSSFDLLGMDLSHLTYMYLHPKSVFCCCKYYILWWRMAYCCELKCVALVSVSLVLLFQVDVVVSLSHDRELTFPAVTICNINPIKHSSLNYSAELEALLTGSASRRRRRAWQGW